MIPSTELLPGISLPYRSGQRGFLSLLNPRSRMPAFFKPHWWKSLMSFDRHDLRPTSKRLAPSIPTNVVFINSLKCFGAMSV